MRKLVWGNANFPGNRRPESACIGIERIPGHAGTEGCESVPPTPLAFLGRGFALQSRREVVSVFLFPHEEIVCESGNGYAAEY